GGVVGHGADGVRRLRRVRLPGSPVVKGHDAIVRREGPSLKRPREVVATDPHDENQRLAPPRPLIKHPNPIDPYFGHDPITYRPSVGMLSRALLARGRARSWPGFGVAGCAETRSLSAGLCATVREGTPQRELAPAHVVEAHHASPEPPFKNVTRSRRRCGPDRRPSALARSLSAPGRSSSTTAHGGRSACGSGSPRAG